MWPPLLLASIIVTNVLRGVQGEVLLWTSSSTSTRAPPSTTPTYSVPAPSVVLGTNTTTTVIITSNTTARTGDVVFLPCETPQSMGKQVSWIRRRDWHILTSGLQTYTKEQRFAVHHPKDSNEWTLAIKYVRLSDAGIYECQIVGGSTSMSQLVQLSVVTPRAVIPGNGEYHVDAGSTISLVCFIQESFEAPQYIFWYHNSRMINYDRERGGISVEIDTLPNVRSRLTVADARETDSGNYTCDAANTDPDSITVYITQVNKIAAVQPRAVESSSRGSTPSITLLHLLLLTMAVLLASAETRTTGMTRTTRRTVSVANGLHYEPD